MMGMIICFPSSFLANLRYYLFIPALFVLFSLAALPTNARQELGTINLTVEAIAGDNIINIAEKIAGFDISGSTSSVKGATVKVTLGMTALDTISDDDGDWKVAVPANAGYITGTGVRRDGGRQQDRVHVPGRCHAYPGH